MELPRVLSESTSECNCVQEVMPLTSLDDWECAVTPSCKVAYVFSSLDECIYAVDMRSGASS